MNLAVYRTISGIACSILMVACAGGYRAMPSEVYALSGSQSIFASNVRVGQMKPEDLPEDFKGARWAERNVDIIFYEGSFKGKSVSSHSYCLSPSVSADVAMTIRGKNPERSMAAPRSH